MTRAHGFPIVPAIVVASGRVVGVDPGLNVTGYAVVERTPRGAAIIEAGVIRPRRSGLGPRLAAIHQGILEILGAFPASALALEQVHSRVAFPRTALLMAHARGAIVLAAELSQTPVFDYAPARVKKTITGNGRAPKSQIQHAIMTEFGLDQLPEPHDVADACAIALCHVALNRDSLGLASGG